MAKPANHEYLERIAQIIAAHPEGITPAAIARALQLPRSTVIRCLPHLERQGILLAEDECGRLFLLCICDTAVA